MRSTPPLLCLLLAACAAAPALDTPPALAAVLDRAAGDDFSGVILVARGERLLAHRAYGLADRREARPMRLDTPFRLCSVTKQFTAVLVMQAVAAGKLRLEQTVAELWPAAPCEHAAKITVRHLLTHKSGLPDPDAAGMHQNPALRGLDHRGLLRALGTAGAALPGESFRYNNADYWLLAVLLEQATGTAYEQLLRERVFAPARMTGAGLYGAAVEPPRGHARGYLGRARAPEPAYVLDTYGAAGAAHGTAQDLWRFDRALLDGRLLDAATFARMTEPDAWGAALGVWAYDLRAGGSTVRLVERQGWIGGIKVLNLVSPSHDLAVIVLANDDAPTLDQTYSGNGLGAELVRAALPE